MYERLAIFLRRAGGGRPVPRPALVLFTKTDLFPDEFRDPEAFARDVFGGTYANLREVLPAVQFAGVSAVGFADADRPIAGNETRPRLDEARVSVVESFVGVLDVLTEAALRRWRRNRVLAVLFLATAAALVAGIWVAVNAWLEGRRQAEQAEFAAAEEAQRRELVGWQVRTAFSPSERVWQSRWIRVDVAWADHPLRVEIESVTCRTDDDVEVFLVPASVYDRLVRDGLSTADDTALSAARLERDVRSNAIVHLDTRVAPAANRRINRVLPRGVYYYLLYNHNLMSHAQVGLYPEIALHWD
jgi:hypothetical protein